MNFLLLIPRGKRNGKHWNEEVPMSGIHLLDILFTNQGQHQAITPVLLQSPN
ncbi:hypothetical protein J2X83_000549 [Brevibacillus nitrificans]|nr:hypothetical protein [Brevibacillus nitrificans]